MVRSRDLGVHVDAIVTMKTRVVDTVSACFSALSQVRSVRRSLPQLASLTLVRALVINTLDYYNSALADTSIPAEPAAVCADCRRYSRQTSERINPLLRELHWLRVSERIRFRLCALLYYCTAGSDTIIVFFGTKPYCNIPTWTTLTGASNTAV